VIVGALATVLVLPEVEDSSRRAGVSAVRLFRESIRSPTFVLPDNSLASTNSDEQPYLVMTSICQQ
jgi:hypothetical protein